MRWFAALFAALVSCSRLVPAVAQDNGYSPGSVFERMRPKVAATATAALAAPSASENPSVIPERSQAPKNVFAIPDEDLPAAAENSAFSPYPSVSPAQETAPQPAASISTAAALPGLPLLTVDSVPDTGDKQLDLLYLQVTMEEEAFKQKRDMKQLSSLVAAHERLIVRLCMPRLLKTLVHKGPPPGALGQRCLEAIEKLLARDLENPIAICARDGIASASCEQASLFQRVSTTATGTWLESLPGLAPSPSELDLDAKLSIESNRERIKALFQKLDGLLGLASPGQGGFVPKGPRADPQSPELQTLFSQLLTLSCAATRVQLTSPEQGTPPRNQIEEIERSLATPTPLPTDFGLKPGRYFRMRMVSQDCLKSIERVKALDPIHAGPACHTWGYFSPQCIDGIRLARIRAAGAFRKAAPAAVDAKVSPTSQMAEF